MAGFVQRATPGVGGGTFVNGYRDLSFMQFSTGDFFDSQQQRGASQ